MKRQRKADQRGITFIGLIFVAGVIAAAGAVTVQIIPTLIELQAINKAVNKASSGTTVAEVRMLFDKQASIDDIKAVRGSDLEVGKEGEKVVVSFAYEREIHLAGPAWLTLKYTGRSK